MLHMSASVRDLDTMPHFKNIIFDMDGLIVDTEPLHQRALNAFMRVAGTGYEFETAEYGRVFSGKPIYENAEYIRERFGLPQNAVLVSEAHRAMFNVLIADARNLEPMAGLRELLEWLQEKAFRIAVASSSRPEQVELIARNLGIDPLFEHIVGNDGTLKPKPEPDVYLLALEKMGAKAAETLALEDSSSGVRAAHAAGLYVIAVPNEFTLHQDFAVADHILPDLVHVREYLAKYKEQEKT